MTRRIIGLGLLLIFSLIFTACSFHDKYSKDAYKQDGLRWVENTLYLVDKSYAEDMDMGGFTQSNFWNKNTKTDLLNTVWYLETLSYLGEKDFFIENKTEYQIKIQELLEQYKQDDSISLAYIYWSVLYIFSKVNIDPPTEMILEIKKYIKDNSDLDGFALTNDKGLSIEGITLLYCKIGMLLNDFHYINKEHVENELSKAANQKEDSLIITYATILNHSNNLDESNKKMINEYFANYIGNNDSGNIMTLSDASFLKSNLESLGIFLELPEKDLVEYKNLFNNYIDNNQGINGRLLYDFVTVIDSKDVREKAKNYIIRNKYQNEWLWSSASLKIPTLKDTNLAIKTYELLGVSIEMERIKKIKNFYEMKNKNIININEYPSLIGIKMFLEKNGFDSTEVDFNKFLKLFREQPLDIQSSIYAEIFFELTLRDIKLNTYDKLLNELDNIILNKTVDVTSYQDKFNLISITGILICHYINNKIDSNDIVKVLEIYKKNEGYTINPYSEYGEVIGNFFVINLYNLIGSDIPSVLQESVSLYRRDEAGYSYYSSDQNHFDIYSTYLGFFAEKMSTEE